MRPTPLLRLLLVLSTMQLLLQCRESDTERTKRLEDRAQLSSMEVQYRQIQLYEQKMPAVLTLGVPLADPEKVQPLGTGFLIDRKGFALTCQHVVHGQSRLAAVHPATGKRYPVQVLDADSLKDIALVRVTFGDAPPTYEPITLEDPPIPKAGSSVLGIGAPAGLDASFMPTQVAYPVRPGADKSRASVSFMQLSHSVIPGASGSPVFDLNGRLVGMMRFTLSASAHEQGPGFAVLARDLREFSESRKDVRQSRREILRGIVEIPAITPYLVQKLELPDGKGVLVAELEPDSPAEKAGLQRYDLILTFAGKPIPDVKGLLGHMEMLGEAQPALFTVWRKGKKIEITVPGRTIQGHN